MAEFFQNDFFYKIDWAIYSFIDSIFNVGENPVADGIWTFITHLGDDGVLWIILGIALLIPKKTRKWGVCLFLGLAVSTLLNNIILKDIIARPRPFWEPGTGRMVDGVFQAWKGEFTWPEGMDYVFPNLIEKSNSWSFPSGHTATSVGAAFAYMLIANKKSGIPVFIVSLLIGISRAYVRIHYPTDVIAGIIVGIISGVIAYVIFKKLIEPKVIPFVEKKLNKEIFAKD